VAAFLDHAAMRRVAVDMAAQVGRAMPELNWAWGYPLAWLAIIASGALPLLWFKRHGWFD
jgi:hypothetical protein